MKTQPRARTGHAMTEAEPGGMRPPDKNCGTTGAGRAALEPQEGAQPCPCRDFRFLVSRAERINTCHLNRFPVGPRTLTQPGIGVWGCSSSP